MSSDNIHFGIYHIQFCTISKQPLYTGSDFGKCDEGIWMCGRGEECTD